MKEQDGLLEKIKEGKVRKYGHWKRRAGSLVAMTIEGEVRGKREEDEGNEAGSTTSQRGRLADWEKCVEQREEIGCRWAGDLPD